MQKICQCYHLCDALLLFWITWCKTFNTVLLLLRDYAKVPLCDVCRHKVSQTWWRHTHTYTEKWKKITFLKCTLKVNSLHFWFVSDFLIPWAAHMLTAVTHPDWLHPDYKWSPQAPQVLAQPSWVSTSQHISTAQKGIKNNTRAPKHPLWVERAVHQEQTN